MFVRVVPRADDKGDVKIYLGLNLDVFTDHTKKASYLRDLQKKYPKVNFQQNIYEANIFKKGYIDLKIAHEEDLKEKLKELDDLKEQYKKIEDEDLKSLPEEKNLRNGILRLLNEGKRTRAEELNQILRKIISVRLDLENLQSKINITANKIKSIEENIRIIDKEIIVSSYEVIAKVQYNVLSSSLNEQKYYFSTNEKDDFHLDEKKILEYMQKHPIKSGDSREKIARNIKNCVIAALSPDVKEELMNIVPKNFFDTKYFEKPESIANWMQQLAKFMHTANELSASKKEISSIKTLKP